jgi:Ca-activated chloride channel family protein
VNYPVLTNLKLDLSTVQTDLVYPRGIPDLFRGSQVTLIGRYGNEANLDSVRLTLSGQSGGTARTYHYDNLAFPVRNENNDYLPRLWATRRVGWLMEQVRTNGEQKELRDEIVDLGTRYGIVTPYTSYLATENEVSSLVTGAGTGAVTRRNSGLMGGQLGAKRKDSAAPMVANNAPTVNLSIGVDAVQQSKRDRERQEAKTLKEETRRDAVQRISGKTFYLIDGVWTDSEFKAETGLPETKLSFGSDEYFAVLKQHPKLANYFSLGERVVVVFEGRVYRVNAATP